MGFRLLAADFWYRDLPGAMLVQMEQALLKKIISHLPGDNLIQIGGPSDLSLVKASSISHKFYISQQKNYFNTSGKIIADITELPFLPESIDMIVLAHILEFEKNPKAILQQLYDMLTPKGYCIIFGFNYWSLWQLAKSVHYRSEGFPWSGHFYSISTVKRWLRLNHFRIVTAKTACFRPPTNSHRILKNLLFLEPIGQFLFPALGGFYMIVAQKRVFSAEPIVAKHWWEKYIVHNNGYVKPTTRNW